MNFKQASIFRSRLGKNLSKMEFDVITVCPSKTHKDCYLGSSYTATEPWNLIEQELQNHENVSTIISQL